MAEATGGRTGGLLERTFAGALADSAIDLEYVVEEWRIGHVQHATYERRKHCSGADAVPSSLASSNLESYSPRG